MNGMVALLLIAVLGFVFHYKYLQEFPSFIHAWAQADRYAIALGFLDNNFQLFKPQTFIMNHPFPNNWEVPSKHSITAVDFPIHEYLVSLIMKISDLKDVWIFRSYILFYSFTGLFFLYKISRFLTKDNYKSFLTLILASTSPVFVYYQGSLLPTIPSLTNVIIGIYFYFIHLKDENNKHFHLSIAFLTLATLSRTTFAIPLIAVFFLEFLRIFEKSHLIKLKLVSIISSVTIIVLYYSYNKILTEKYGSIFLNHLMLPANFQEAQEILQEVYNNWLNQYFSKIHYFIFIISFLISFFFLFKREPADKFQKQAGLLIFFIFSGYMLFAILMLGQFAHHDYYFLDTFFFPVILFFILSLSLIPKVNFKFYRELCIIGLVFIGIALATNAFNFQQSRRVVFPGDLQYAKIKNFTNSEAFLDSLYIDKKAKILVIDQYSPNIPFIFMNRKGYTTIILERNHIENLLSWDYNYVVMQNELFVSEIYPLYPDILLRIEKIADNGKISVYKRLIQSSLNLH